MPDAHGTYHDWLVMTADNARVRPWQEIGRELSAQKTDHEKIRNLSHELNEALEKQVGENWKDYSKARATD